MKENPVIAYIAQKLNRYPNLKQKIGDFLILIWRFKLKFKKCDMGFNVDRTYWINPNKIIYAIKGTDEIITGFDIVKDKGKIISGDWDLPENRIRFEDLDVYQAFYQRFVEGKSWQETDFYRRVVTEISKGKVKFGCKTKEEFDERCKKLDKLYQNIKNNGYKTQKEISMNYRNRLLSEEDEIAVSIARTGELLFNNGMHRLSIAKILNLEKIPVKITVRHPGWVEFRKQILNQTGKNGKVYHPLTHPDLADIPSEHGDERFEIIKRNLSTKKGTLLDIGSHWGYFCHKFEEIGFHCYAVESSPRNVYFLKKLKQAENRKFEVINKSIFEYREKSDFDVVLALNIFHHFLKKKELYFKLIELLKRLKTKELFLQTHRYDEAQMKGAYKNYSPEEFVEFVLENSCLDEAKLIGEEDGRPIYKLYKRN